jgi:hypothetical protein
MNLIVTIWDKKRNVITASITDAEAFAKLKVWAEGEGYRVELQEDDQERALRRVGKR